MNKILSAVICTLFLATSAGAAEPWKGTPPANNFSLGFTSGLGLVEPKYGFAITGHLSKTIMNQGFVPDLNNPVSIEIEAGPIFVAGETPLFTSTHLRWDWIYDESWTVFAMAGLGFQITGDNLGDRTLLSPRIGAGAFYHLMQNMSLRLEVSHELTGVGLTFDF